MAAAVAGHKACVKALLSSPLLGSQRASMAQDSLVNCIMHASCFDVNHDTCGSVASNNHPRTGCLAHLLCVCVCVCVCVHARTHASVCIVWAKCVHV